ncbi:MAG: hypothetical protein ACTIJJ_04490 [Galactobacter sp.]
MDVETLLAGPRGRRLLLCFVTSWPDEQDRTDPELDAALNVADETLDVDGSCQSNYVVLAGGDEGSDHDELMREVERERREHAAKIAAAKADPSPLLEVIAAGLERTPLPPATVSAVMQALEDSVACARYWQHPDGLDVALAGPRVMDALRRVAQHVLPACGWMERPIDRDQSWALSYSDGEFRNLSRVAKSLKSERSGANQEGSGWDTPTGFCPETTGPSPDPARPGPLKLYCEEDDMGLENRRAQRIVVTSSDRVLEIRSAEDWADLCARFPLDVTRGRDDWSESTGRRGRWVTPDIAAASRHYDGIHLTIAAYLACSGVVIPVAPSNGRENGASMIAGWHPDATVWLSDRTSAETVRWLWRDEDDWPVYRYELDPESVSE